MQSFYKIRRTEFQLVKKIHETDFAESFCYAKTETALKILNILNILSTNYRKYRIPEKEEAKMHSLVLVLLFHLSIFDILLPRFVVFLHSFSDWINIIPKILVNIAEESCAMLDEIISILWSEFVNR